MNKKEFREKVETFLEITKMSPTAFGKKSKSEPNFVFTLRKGRECHESIQIRVCDFMKKYINDNNLPDILN